MHRNEWTINLQFILASLQNGRESKGHKFLLKKLRGFSPQANYTDRAKLGPTLADRGCRVVSETDPHGRNLGFLDPINSSYNILLLLEIFWIWRR
jgi:hypothetical protein